MGNKDRSKTKKKDNDATEVETTAEQSSDTKFSGEGEVPAVANGGAAAGATASQQAYDDDDVKTIGQMSVGVMKNPKWIGTKVGTLSRGDKVTILEKKGDWRRIKCGTLTGWVNNSVFVWGHYKVAKPDFDETSEATEEEDERNGIYMAGRG